MADSAAFETGRRNSDYIPVAARTNELSAEPQASRPGSARGPLRPSQVPARPVPGLLSGSGQPLDAPLREEMEARLGADFAQVRVHTDSAARASAAEVGARAYTVGDHVVIGDGGAGKQTLAHELTHVIQQREGPVAGTDRGNGLKVSDPLDAFEKAAEANAARVIQQRQVPDRTPRAPGVQRGLQQGPVLQRLKKAGGALWSVNDRYVTHDMAVANSPVPQNQLGIATGAQPDLTGAEWSATGGTVGRVEKGKNVEVSLYTLHWERSSPGRKGAEVKVPKDCITTAELVAAWLMTQDPEVIGEVKTEPSIKPATRNTAVSPGDILFHVHASGGGEFHAAAAIAEDAGDVVTLEADASSGATVGAAKPIFDMYEGPARHARSFEKMQKGSGDVERTYVISFLVDEGRSTAADTLWSGLQAFTLGTSAQQAAERIKSAIQAAIQAAAGRSGGGPMRHKGQSKPKRKPY